MRIEHKYRLPKTPSHSLNSSDLIGITRNDNETFRVGLRCIQHHLDSHVDIGSFFLESHDTQKTISWHFAILALRFVDG